MNGMEPSSQSMRATVGGWRHPESMDRILSLLKRGDATTALEADQMLFDLLGGDLTLLTAYLRDWLGCCLPSTAPTASISVCRWVEPYWITDELTFRAMAHLLQIESLIEIDDDDNEEFQVWVVTADNRMLPYAG